MSRDNNDKRLSKIEAAVGKIVDPLDAVRSAISHTVICYALGGRVDRTVDKNGFLSVDAVMSWKILDDEKLIDNLVKIKLLNQEQRQDRRRIAMCIIAIYENGMRQIREYQARKAAAA
jgi:hypothetical protein